MATNALGDAGEPPGAPPGAKEGIGRSALIPTLTFGLVLGALQVAFALSFAALVFGGSLSAHVGSGAGLALVSATVILFVVALGSSLSGSVASVQDSTAAVLALMAAQIAAGVPAAGDGAFLTVVAAIATTTVATGVFLLALGLLGLGNLVRFVPYPVVGGFLAGTGWLLAKGGVGVLTGVSISLSTFTDIFASEALARCLAGLGFAVAVVILARRLTHFLVVPGAIVAAVACFYLILAVTGTSVSEAEAGGWLLGPFPDTALWEPWTIEAVGEADWSAVFSQLPNTATVLLVAVVALLLNTSGIELAVNRDLDLNRELRAAGVANVFAGAGGGMVGFQALSLTTLAYRSGARRLVGVLAALACAIAVLGGSFLALFPRVVVGGLLLFLGLSFLLEWVYDAWFRLPRADYLVVLLIVVVIAAFGFLPGVGVGLAVALILFVVDYSRTDVVKHTLSGGSYRSRVERDTQQLDVLRARGDEVSILELQGFLFFGTANSLLEKVRKRAFDASLPPLSFLVLDFRRVSGLDSSAVIAFVKAYRLAEAQGFTLAMAQLSGRVRAQLERGGFSPQTMPDLQVFPDLDHAVEWCEERLIEREAAEARREGREREPLAALLGDELGLAIDDDRLRRYLEPLEIPAGHELILQGEPSTDVYLLESGRLTAVLARADGERIRIRTMAPGTVVGEVTMYLRTVRGATVVSEEASRVYRLSERALAEMERDDPHLAHELHRAFARLLARRLTDSLRAMEAVLD